MIECDMLDLTFVCTIIACSNPNDNMLAWTATGIISCNPSLNSTSNAINISKTAINEK